MDKIGICVITYNRINSLRRVLKSLNDANYPHDVDLIISIDKSDCEDVPTYANKFEWHHGHKIVMTHEQNLGLRRHILSCGDQLENYDALVVLEDDITVAQSFFYYVEQCVTKYKNDDSIAGISLYRAQLHHYALLPFIPMQTDSDVFLMQVAQSWGQVWMKKQWKEFKNWYNTHNKAFEVQPHLPKTICRWKNSWLKYHDRYCIEQNKFFIYPYVALSTNHSDTGTHNNSSYSWFQAPLLFGDKIDFKLNPTIKYDGFFESINLLKYLNLPPQDICIDIYGQKQNREGKRYWLSCTKQPYKIIKSYSMAMKPIEYNIINDIKGQEIFLYDTTIKRKQALQDTETQVKSYFYATDMNVLNLLKRKIKRKVLRILKILD